MVGLLIDTCMFAGILADNFRLLGLQLTEADTLAAALARSLTGQFERLIVSEAHVSSVAVKFALSAAQRPDGPRQVLESFLSLLDSLPSDELTNLLSTEIVRSVVRNVRSDGTKSQRKLLKRILARERRKRGRPDKPREQHSDVQLLRLVKETRGRLEPAFNRVHELRGVGGYASDPDAIRAELKQKNDLSPHEIEAIMKSRTLLRAAIRLVADEKGVSIGAVNAAVSSGKGFARSGTRPKTLR
jgi:hypothetical protein